MPPYGIKSLNNVGIHLTLQMVSQAYHDDIQRIYIQRSLVPSLYGQSMTIAEHGDPLTNMQP